MERTALLLAAASTALGHNWVESPLTRNGNTDSTTTPCPAGTDAMTPQVGVISADTSFDVTWTTNHDGDHFLKTVPLSQEGDLETIDASGALFYQTYDNAVATGTVNLGDEKILPGFYVVQYGWENYRNCITVQLLGTGGTPFGLEGQNPTEPALETSCQQYCMDLLGFCSDHHSFSEMDQCLETCGTYPTNGNDGDTGGNSLQCRTYHLTMAGGLASTHCPHATPGGGQVCEGGEEFRPAVVFRVQTAEYSEAGLENVFDEALTNYGGYQALSVSADLTTPDQFIVVVQFSPVSGNGEAQAAALRADPTVLELDTTDPVTFQVVGASGSNTFFGGLGGNTTAAVVCLILLLIAGAVLTYVKKDALLNKVNAWVNIEETTSQYLILGADAFCFIFFIVILAGNSWAVEADGVSVGLFKYCPDDGDCVSLDDVTPEATSLLDAIRAFFILAFLFNVFSMGCVGAVAFKEVTANWVYNGILVGQGLPLIWTTLSFCFYAAYYHDVLSPALTDSSLGSSYGLIFLIWLLEIPSMVLALKVAFFGATPNPQKTEAMKAEPIP